MTLHVELVIPDRRVWAGGSSLVIAKTLEGDIGIMTGHPPVFAVLVTGSLVRILDASPGESGEAAQVAAGDRTQGEEGFTPGEEVAVAVGGGFLSVADGRVSILASEAELGSDVDAAAARAELEAALAAGGKLPDGEETAEVKYVRARLRAAGEES